MNKKTYLLVVIGLVILIVVLYLFITWSKNEKPVVNAPVSNTPVEDLDRPASPSAYSPRSDLVPQETQTIKVNGADFTPREFSFKAGSKVILILSGGDEVEHKITFTDQVLSYIDLTFSKVSGDKTITFPAPKVGNYNFYIDNQNNKGVLNIQ